MSYSVIPKKDYGPCPASAQPGSTHPDRGSAAGGPTPTARLGRLATIYRLVRVKLGKSLERRGIVGTLRWGAYHTCELVRSCTGRNLGNDEAGLEFDRKYNVNTCGKIELIQLNIPSPSLPYGNLYQAVAVETFLEALQRLPIQYEQFVFLDLGCGKGRALMLASELPFRRIIGVEFAPALCEIARDNLCRFQRARRKPPDWEVVCADAVQYSLPEEPLVLFIFNSFEAEILDAVLQNLCRSLDSRPRTVYAIYMNPKHALPWEKGGRFRIVHADSRYNIYAAGTGQ